MARIIVAIDTPDIQQMKTLYDELGDLPILYKIGMEFVQAIGPQGIHAYKAIGVHDDQLFIDQKFADIPATVAAAARGALGHCQPLLMNVFGPAGRPSVAAFVETVREKSPATQPIAVTVLTTFSDAASLEIYGRDCRDGTLHFAGIAQETGCEGIVCHGRFASLIRERFGRNLTIVTPGIRFPGDATDDQHDPVHPRQAVLAGSDFLVVGRPIRTPRTGTRRDAALRFIEAATL